MNDARPEDRSVPGNHPLRLDDPDVVWQVIEGWVDLFAVLPGDGRRVHLLRAEPVDHLFGVAPAPGQAELLVVGTLTSRLRPLPRGQFEQSLAKVARPLQFVALVDWWVRGLTAALTRGGLPPRDVSPLVPGSEARPRSGEILAPIRGTVWVPGAGLIFLGPEGTPSGGQALLPVAAPGWMTAAVGTRFTPLPTEQVLADPRAWAGLDAFHQLVLGRLERQTGEAARQLREQVELRVRRDRDLLEQAKVGLTRVPESGPEDDLTPGEKPDPLLSACRLVGAAVGVAVRKPPGTLERTQSGRTVASIPGWTLFGRADLANVSGKMDPVDAIARASRFSARRVRLDGDWWRRDNGPLLGFRESDDRPLALLPTSPTRYDVVDTTSGERYPLAAEQRVKYRVKAGDLNPEKAYQFFRPLPARALSPWRLFHFSLAGTRRDWLWVFLLGVAGGVVAMFPPVATGWVFDRVIPGADRSLLMLVVFALTATALAAVLVRFARNVAVLRLETRMDVGLQSGLWDRLLNLPPSFFRRFPAGDLLSRVAGVNSIRWLLTDAALSALLNLAFALVYFVVLLWYDRGLAGLAAGLFVAVLAVTVYAGFLQLAPQRRAYHARGETDSLVLQLLTGLSRLQAADATARALAVWAHKFARQRRQEYRSRRIADALATFATAAPILCTVVLFGTVALFPRPGLSLGAFLAFNAAFVALLSSALAVSKTAGVLIEVVPLYERVRPILDAVPEADAATTIPGDLRGEIEVRKVAFRYQPDGPLVLSDLSLHIRSGEFIALVGASGAGKTTLLRLLLGFERPTSGAVFYDREDMAGLDLQSLRRQIGVVLQSVHPLPGTIRDNILGSAPLTEADAWEAARLVGLEEYIRGLPAQMNTVLAEAGKDLSGGQRQLLMIARAIACKPRILFFDEATSALDNATQARITTGLETLKATRVVVAHRQSTIQNADRIVGFDAGRIVRVAVRDGDQYSEFDEAGGLVGKGNSAWLMRPEGWFARLFRRQQPGSGPEASPG